MGPMTRFSTSLGVAPGMVTWMSIMGTMICGSSSLGVDQTARTPVRAAARMMSGASLESTKTAVRRASQSAWWP